MFALYTADQTRVLDRTAIEAFSIPGIELMNRAGGAVHQLLEARYPVARRMTIVCGVGNNAGDGYVVGRLSMQSGRQVILISLTDPDRLAGDAAAARDAYLEAGGAIRDWQGKLPGSDLLVDGLLGTGLTRDVEGPFAAAVHALNEASEPVVALDIPSGLDADTGAVRGVAVRANHTVTFIGRKRGLYTGEGGVHCGRVVFDDLGVPKAIYERVPGNCDGLTTADLDSRLLRRSRTAHKGAHGRVLVIGGNHGMPGAARLAAEAALRSGAGLVRIATRREHAALLALSYPALMAEGCESPEAFRAATQWCDVIVVGPGLGADDWTDAAMQAALAADKPALIDADGLNWLARAPQPVGGMVLTPHPGEAARLLGCSTADVAADRFAAAAALAERYSARVVLKGAGTIVADGGRFSVCCAGNPGLATAGSGDVLSGVLGALMAQRIDDSVATAVLAHACAGDRCAEFGERGMTAVDLLDHLRAVLNP